MPRGVVLRSLGVNFLPLKVDFWLQGLDLSLPKYVLSLWKWILIFRSQFGHNESILGSERETRKSAFDIIHFAKKLTFAGLKKYSIVQERFEKKSTLWGGRG